MSEPEFVFDTRADLRPDQKAEVLVQALPWLQEFAGALVVVKYGGNAMVDETLKRAFARSCNVCAARLTQQVGVKAVIKAARDLGITTQVLPFLVVGGLLALGLGRGLNTLALGDDVARGLGARVGLLRLATAVAVTLMLGQRRP